MPGGKTWRLMFSTVALTRAKTSVAFSPRRKYTMPSTESGLSLNWNMPKRGALPISTLATSPIRIGTPLLMVMTTRLMSSMFLSRPTPRTTNCCSPLGNKPPPVLLLALFKATISWFTDMPFDCRLSGLTITWYWRTLPPKEETSATPGVCFNSL